MGGRARSSFLHNDQWHLTAASTLLVMDIDEPEVQIVGSSKARRLNAVPVDEIHPFDLENYISSYSGPCLLPSSPLNCPKLYISMF